MAEQPRKPRRKRRGSGDTPAAADESRQATIVAKPSSGPDEARAAAVRTLAAQAEDPDKVKAALIDAANMARNIWITFISFGAYLVIAVGAVTHRQLFLEQPIKLPLLNVDLPLVGFFVVAPLLFLIFHLYLLLHLKLMADKVRRFSELIRGFGLEKTIEDRVRLQLPNFVFVQFLAGTREGRKNFTELLLMAIAWITVVIGPILLLLMIQLQFLPYHLEGVTWVQRLVLVADLGLLWWFWPQILRGTAMGRGTAIALQTATTVLSLLLAGFSTLIATFPGERIYHNMIAWNIQIPVPKKYFVQEPDREYASLTEFLFQGTIDQIQGLPTSWLSNRLVLAGQRFIDIETLDKIIARQERERRLSWESERTRSFRGRDLREAIFIRADLRRVDFTGANLDRANFENALLQGVQIACNVVDQFLPWTSVSDRLNWAWHHSEQLRQRGPPGCASLKNAIFDGARLEGAYLRWADLRNSSLERANLKEAYLDGAKLQGVRLFGARLQSASLIGTRLQGSDLRFANLQGALLDAAWLQGANLDETELQGASLEYAKLHGAFVRYNPKFHAASLAHAELWGIEFAGSEINGANLAQSDVRQASLPNERYLADFSDIHLGEDSQLSSIVRKDALLEVVGTTTRRAIESRLERLEGAPSTYMNSDNWRKAASVQEPLLVYAYELASFLIGLGCAENVGSPVARGLIWNGRIAATLHHSARIESRFVANDSCLGAKALRDDDKRELQRVVGEGQNELKKRLIERVCAKDSASHAARDLIQVGRTKGRSHALEIKEEYLKVSKAMEKAFQEAMSESDTKTGVSEELANRSARIEEAFKLNWDGMIEDTGPYAVEIEARFLDAKGCPGAADLSDDDKRRLRAIVEKNAPASAVTADRAQ